MQSAHRLSTVVVNCGRGGLLDLDAVLSALDDGRLSGLGPDVYPVEPLPAIGWRAPEARATILGVE